MRAADNKKGTIGTGLFDIIEFFRILVYAKN
jgi:hypothetical protein